MTRLRPILEIAVQCLADAHAAHNGGADRLELCSALDLHGLTPSAGLLRQLRKLSLPIMVMIRPRPGDFVYAASEIEQMEFEIKESAALGADGFVFGCLRRDCSVDTDTCERLLRVCAGRPAIFHRAFDLVSDRAASLELLIQLSFQRVLTSGGDFNTTIDASRAHIAELQQQSQGRITVMPGGGVRAENIAALRVASGCNEFHAACRKQALREALDVKFQALFGSSPHSAGTQEAEVRALRHALDACS